MTSARSIVSFARSLRGQEAVIDWRLLSPDERQALQEALDAWADDLAQDAVVSTAPGRALEAWARSASAARLGLDIGDAYISYDTVESVIFQTLRTALYRRWWLIAEQVSDPVAQGWEQGAQWIALATPLAQVYELLVSSDEWENGEGGVLAPGWQIESWRESESAPYRIVTDRAPEFGRLLARYAPWRRWD